VRHTTGLHFKSKVSGSKFTLLAQMRTHVWTCVTYPRPMELIRLFSAIWKVGGTKWTPV
jgi:hypothetical protein